MKHHGLCQHILVWLFDWCCLYEVPEELWEANELQPGANHGRRDDIVHKEGARVGQEDAVPPAQHEAKV